MRFITKFQTRSQQSPNLSPLFPFPGHSLRSYVHHINQIIRTPSSLPPLTLIWSASRVVFPYQNLITTLFLLKRSMVPNCLWDKGQASQHSFFIHCPSQRGACHHVPALSVSQCGYAPKSEASPTCQTFPINVAPYQAIWVSPSVSLH